MSDFFPLVSLYFLVFLFEYAVLTTSIFSGAPECFSLLVFLQSALPLGAVWSLVKNRTFKDVIDQAMVTRVGVAIDIRLGEL